MDQDESAGPAQPADDVASTLQQLEVALRDLGVDSGMRSAITTLALAAAVHADPAALAAPIHADPAAPIHADPAALDPAAGEAQSHSPTSPSSPTQTHSLVRGGVSYSSIPVPSEDRWTDEAVLETVRAAERVQGWADYLSLLAVRVLTARTGAELLARDDFSSEDELPSATRRERFRAATRAAVRMELSALTGWTQTACNERIGLATAAPARGAFAMQQLSAGEVTWGQVRLWAQRTAQFEPAAAGRVAQVCLDPVGAQGGAAATVDPETGEVTGAVLSFNQFVRVLEREAVRVEGGPDQSSRERRRIELSQRDLRTRMFEHGTAQMSLTGDGPALAAAAARIDTAARRLRAAGDKRPLAAIRADTALALLGHGQLPGGPEAPADPVSGVVGDTETMRRVLMGLPSVSVELVVPLEVLTGDSRAVAELGDLGYITAEHARELILHAGADGTTIHRLLTDPVDGRCLERSRKAYRPDKAMLDQLRAADGTCRAPGCTVPAGRSDVDHEHPYDHDDPACGGPTSETNLNHKHRYHHWAKTEHLWTTAMDALSRKVTWTSLFGRCYRTSPKDYRPLAGTSPGRRQEPEPCGHRHTDLAEDLACRRRHRNDRQQRDRTRLAVLRDAGVVTRYYERRWVLAVHDLLDGLYYEAHPEEPLPEAVAPVPGRDEPLPVAAVFYAAVAEQQSCPDVVQQAHLDLADTVPVELAHLRGRHPRRGPRRDLPGVTDLLASLAPDASSGRSRTGRHATPSRTPLEPPPVDPDEPPPF